MPNPLVTCGDTAFAEDHRRQLLTEAAHRQAVVTASKPARVLTPSEHGRHPIVAFPADAWTEMDAPPAPRPARRRQRLGSAQEWLRWMRTYALLWLAGVVFYLLLAAGAFIADGYFVLGQ